MCNKCRDKIHPKIRNAEDHTVVDIKQTEVSGGIRNIDFTNIKCKVHTTQSCCIFCSSCDELACPSCITKGHAGHTFIEIKNAYEMKVEWLKKSKGNLKMNEKRLDEGDKTLEQITVRESSNRQKTIQDIQHRRESLKTEVDKYALKLIQVVNISMENIQDSISRKKKNVTAGRKKVENNLKTAEEMLTTIDMTFFFENADIIANSFNDSVEGVNVICKRVPNFKPGSILQSNVGILFADNSSRNTVISMKVNKEFTTGIKHCQFLHACSEGALWLGDDMYKRLYKVNPEGNIITTILTINNTELQDIAVMHNNDLLVTEGTSRLKLVNGKTGKISDSPYSLDLLKIIGVHITNDNNVILGARSHGAAFPVTGRRVVVVMDQKGDQLIEYELDKHQQQIFSYPWRITSTINGNIFVIDCLSEDDRGRVLVLCEGGDILNEYTGCQNINTMDRPFKPACITTAPTDNVIVIDAYNLLYILDNSANLIFHYNINDLEVIKYPLCIVCTSETTLYLGCSPPANSTTNAKLYEIQCSGF
ncbi:Hypothetical predicted protein [Mytilus galloprovincialis]|uniref:B box-type domain-containing protein n=1 Tax=Mytilus galloprovincialis TaxID=29158 RepID=A0A8B6EA90_MYTGA|nr:Hypothetical predicted protein [Mytilus galloprovincialis]